MVWKVAEWSGKFPVGWKISEWLESFRIVWKVTGRSGKLKDGLERFGVIINLRNDQVINFEDCVLGRGANNQLL